MVWFVMSMSREVSGHKRANVRGICPRGDTGFELPLIHGDTVDSFGGPQPRSGVREQRAHTSRSEVSAISPEVARVTVPRVTVPGPTSSPAYHGDDAS